MIRVDMQGVPTIVQRVEYDFGGFWFRFTLFDTLFDSSSEEAKIDAGFVRGMDITIQEPSDRQFEEAERIYLEFKKRGI